jgi:hypothetical protein
MLQHYSHIHSQAKQAAIRALEAEAIEPDMSEHVQRNGQSDRQDGNPAVPNLQKTNGGPARILTWDEQIMSSKNGNCDDE